MKQGKVEDEIERKERRKEGEKKGKIIYILNVKNGASFSSISVVYELNENFCFRIS